MRTELESDGRVAIVFLEVNPRVSKQNSIGVGQDEVKRGAAMLSSMCARRRTDPARTWSQLNQHEMMVWLSSVCSPR